MDVRLLCEGFYRGGKTCIARLFAACYLNVTIAGLRPCRNNAHRQQDIVLGSINHGLFRCLAGVFVPADDVICRHHYHYGLRIPFDNRVSRINGTGCGVAPYGLKQKVIIRQLRNKIFDVVFVFFKGGDQNVLCGNQIQTSFICEAQHGFAARTDRSELLWFVVAAPWP